MAFASSGAASPFSTFMISWWYSPDTKLGIYFNNFGLNQVPGQLTSLVNGGVDYLNGMGCSIEEDYHFENLITNHPVENQESISDHIIPQPPVITVTGLITSIRPTILLGGLDFSQLGNATEMLVQMWQTRTGLSLQTGLLYGKKYLRVDNLAVQSLDIPRNNQYGKASIKFTIVLKQLMITSLDNSITPSAYSQASETTVVTV